MSTPTLNPLPPPEWHPRQTPEGVCFDGFCTKLQHLAGPEVIVTAASVDALEAFAVGLGFPFDRKAVNRVAVMARRRTVAPKPEGSK